MIVENPPVQFRLHPSTYLLVGQCGLAILATVILVGLPLLWWVRLVSIGLTMLLGLGYLKAWRSRGIEILWWKPAADLWILSAGQTRVQLCLQDSQFVTASLVILYFKTAAGKPGLRVVPRDALSASEHRLLRQLLMAR